TVTFNKDGFYDSTAGSNTLKLTTGGIEQTFPQNSSFGYGMWLKEDGTLKLTGELDAGVSTFHIKTLTSTVLELESNDLSSMMGGMEGLDAGGVENFHLLITLNRL